MVAAGGSSGKPIEMKGRSDRWAEAGLCRRPAFENSDVGQAVISALVSLILMIGVAWNLPASKIKDTLTPVLEPVAQAMGLEQVWKMYAPDVIRQLEFTNVQVTMADGSVRTWEAPGGDKVIGPFVWYHWQKLKENLPRDPSSRADVAHWVVRQLTDPSEKPTRVQIAFRTVDISPPGQDGGPQTAHVEILYDESLSSRP